ncbi:hypothetical protein [Jeotgalibacillus haloalkalitolerans]|uniref:Phage protein n=1 Tax=Jeotgalibacillus haloalkalitolerans TaxID=3104292 RepID=A0ABU5KM97_9BACL|nr:hypothetical protein [Jeotgalibacillus sp. HH7-29]MDZ5712389.1 hypothetical protein [Jeotgalibacillus sp. HH7-29]
MNGKLQEEIKNLSEEIHKLDRWAVRFDEKVNGYPKIEKRADEAYYLADRAEDKSEEAYKACEVNARDIQALEMRCKWFFGMMAPFILMMIGKLFS